MTKFHHTQHGMALVCREIHTDTDHLKEHQRVKQLIHKHTLTHTLMGIYGWKTI